MVVWYTSALAAVSDGMKGDNEDRRRGIQTRETRIEESRCVRIVANAGAAKALGLSSNK